MVEETNSLLNLATSNNTTCWVDIIEFLDHSTRVEAQASIRETNDTGETTLHILLRNAPSISAVGESSSAGRDITLLDVVKRIIQVDYIEHDGVDDGDSERRTSTTSISLLTNNTQTETCAIQDDRGYLPLHIACEERCCSFDIISCLIKAYPQGLGYTNKKGYTPFGWDFDISIGAHFIDFLQNVVATDECSSGVKASTRKMRKTKHRLLSHCKNYMPLDILKKGMLNEQVLEYKAMIRWLNEMPTKRDIVCSMVFELYLHIAWIVLFIHTTWLHIELNKQLQGWEPIALIVSAALFFIQEVYQLYRFAKTNAAIAYWLDIWNWIDLSTVALVVASSIGFLNADESIHMDRLLMSTGCFQFILLVSYLKKTFFPFSKFVHGIIQIFIAIIPFLVVSFVTLLAFSYMYYVQQRDSPDYNSYDPYAHNSPNPYATLTTSFKTIYEPFASGPLENNNTLDFIFGICIVIVLLNVIIAIVTEAWEEATVEANRAFWSYRLDLILEKTRGVEDRSFQYCGSFRDIDDFYINLDSVGTTSIEMKAKLAKTYREEGVCFCIYTIFKSLSWIILGFPTFGVLWPKFFRQLLFTPPQPKEDDIKVQMDHLANEVAKLQQQLLTSKDK